MHDMTAANLRSAFGGESMANIRYLIWGAKAAEDGFPNVGRLFTAVSRAEQVHAANHFEALKDQAGAFLVPSMAGFGLGGTSENLAGAVEGETFEIEEMYPTYLQDAKFQSEGQARKTFHYALEAEKIHARMFAEAKKAVEAGKDPSLGPIQICLVCGHTVEGDAPEKCPVCGVGRDKFQTFA